MQSEGFMDRISRTEIIEICIAQLNERAEVARHAMNSAQESANAEEKSSAGDKYETGRAMSQLERDMNAWQLLKIESEINYLKNLPVQQSSLTGAGSIIHTSQGLYFIGPALGKVNNKGISFIALSATSPLGKLLIGKKVGETIPFRDQQIEITGIE